MSPPVYPPMIYCGCWKSVGHFTWAEGMKERWLGGAGPWKHLDSKTLHPDAHGDAWLTHLDGWTALGIGDRSVDRRPNSHSTFAVEGTYEFDEMLSMARTAFPAVVARIEAMGPIRLAGGHNTP